MLGNKITENIRKLFFFFYRYFNVIDTSKV